MATDYVAYGIFPDRAAFDSALEGLRAANFRNSDISAILPDRDNTTRDLAHEINTKAPEGIATGAGAGAAVGGVLAGSQGRPPGVEAAHLRFFLEPWATLHSGQAVDFARYP